MGKIARRVTALFALALWTFACSPAAERQVPTQGIVTTVREVEPDQYKIVDEVTVPDTADSRIIAEHLDGQVDTFSLAEARMAEQQGYQNHQQGGLLRMASYGLMGYMLGRSMGAGPMSSAYINPQTYNRVNSTAGQNLRQSATRTRVSSGTRTGFGGGRSTRSFGG